MQTRENYKRGKGGREKSRLPGTSTSEFFFGSHPKRKQQNASQTIGCDIVKYAKAWLF